MAEVTIRLGVGALILNDQGELLLGLRNVDDNKGQWELLGGLARPDETLEEAVRRQVMEEAGIQVEPQMIVAHYDRYFDDGSIRNAGFTFRCRLLGGEPRRTELDRVAEFRWVTLKAAFELTLTPFTRLQLEQYQAWCELVKQLG